MSSTSEGCTFPKLEEGLLNSPLRMERKSHHTSKTYQLQTQVPRKPTYGWRSFTFFCALLGLPSSSELFTLDLVLAIFFSFCLESPGITHKHHYLHICLPWQSWSQQITKTKTKQWICTFLPFTGGGIIICALNLLFLQVSLKSGQVRVKTSDVFVDLQKNNINFITPKVVQSWSFSTAAIHVFQGFRYILTTNVNQNIYFEDTNHLVGLHGQLHLVISKLFAFTVWLLNLSQYGQLLLRGKSPGIGCVLFSQGVYLSL